MSSKMLPKSYGTFEKRASDPSPGSGALSFVTIGPCLQI